MRTYVSVPTESVTAIDPLVALLVGAFGAALLTVVGGLIGAWIQSIREHRKWLRERRFEAYRDFMINMSQLSHILSAKIDASRAVNVRAGLDAWSDQIVRSGEAVSILGPKVVNAAGQDWLGAAQAQAEDNSEANKEAMRRGRWKFLVAVSKELNSKSVGELPPVARPL
jgi:hypothetical protein